MTWLSSLAALPGLKSGLLPLRPALRNAADALRKSLDGVDDRAFAKAVDAEARRRLARFAEGVERYRRQPRPARPPEPPAFWRRGSTRVLDYGGAAKSRGALLVVPSLINRGYILDLTAERSLMRHLAAAGWRPFLVDWGAPGATERLFSLTDYIVGRLEPAVDAIAREAGGPPALIGYCMGGLLTLALAARRPDSASALAFLATPWDFHATLPGAVRMMQAAAPSLIDLVDRVGELPVDVIQAMFASLDPYLTADKFRRFAALDAASRKARDFVALEDWLNDGVPLVGSVARECLLGWYVENTPAEGRWRVDGKPVAADRVRLPALVVIPQNDHIVPPGSARALADVMPGARSLVLPAGHIGMVAGSRARAMLYAPLARWLDRTLT
jgi:polyhydroxyalkanoate synthase